MIYEFNICMGLPGSGKTEFIKNDIRATKSSAKAKDFTIDLDHYIHTGKTITDVLYSELDKKHLDRWKSVYNKTVVYIDGLILTFDTLVEVINTCKSVLNFTDEDTVIFNIHHWDEDREQCLKNDEYRIKSGKRNKSAKSTIKHAKFDNVEHYGTTKPVDNIKYNVIKHKVYITDFYNAVFKSNATNKDFMYSKSWAMGGEEGNCWNSNIVAIAPEEPYTVFREFESLVWHIAPDIKFWEYKKLYNACVTIEKSTDYGYYGSWEMYAQFKCDLRKLYNMMKDMNLINETE